MTKANPFSEQDVTRQLDSWASALEMAVATLNRTLIEVREYQSVKGVVPDDGNSKPAAKSGSDDCGDDGGGSSDQ